MKTALISLFRWPWLRVAAAACLVVPWICYALAGYIEADREFQFAAGGVRWSQPGADVFPLSALITFAAVVFIGLAVDAFHDRRRRGW